MSPTPARTPFGQRLYEARKHAKLTQPQLAKLVGMGQSTLAEAEYTAQGSSFVTQIARATGVRSEWLSEGTGAMTDKKAWPFAIPIERYHDLEEKQKGIVEGRLISAIEDAERATRKGRPRRTVELEPIDEPNVNKSQERKRG